MARVFCIIYGKPTQASRMYAQYKVCTSVKKRLQFASLILVFGMQICVSLYHSRFCRSASCNHLDPEAVITHSGIQMFKCKLRLSNPPRHKHANCCWWCCIQCKPVYFEGTEAYGHVLSDESLAGDSFLLEGTGGCGTQSLKGLQQLIVIGNRVFLAAPVNQRLPTIKQSAKQYVTPC